MPKRATKASFDHFSWENNSFKFFYSWDDKISFKHEVTLSDLPTSINPNTHPDWEAFALNLGLSRFPYYFAPVNPKVIDIKAGKLDKNALNLWRSWYVNGLGEYFFKNNLPLALNITNSAKKEFRLSRKKIKSNSSLLLNGGGKDSAVSGEIAKMAEIRYVWFILNNNIPRDSIVKNSPVTTRILAKGITQNPKNYALEYLGYVYKGHQPLSIYLAAVSTLASYLFSHTYITTSNEKSANEANVSYRNKLINHQYTKSFKFEKQYHSYTKKYLNEDLYYYSILRPLYEIQIVKLFSRFPQYHKWFVSCNQGVKSNTWCTKCSKCSFIFLALYPFIDTHKLTGIFGENLLDKESLLDDYLSLTGEKNFKPFDCVGTTKESLLAMYLASKKENPPFIVRYFMENTNINKGEKLTSLLSNYDNTNLISSIWAPEIKKIIQKLLNY